MKKTCLIATVLSLATAAFADESLVQITFGKPALTDRRLVNADADVDNWLTHGRTYHEQRFSPLKTINDKNVSKLGLAWSFEFPDHRELEATPLVVDGVMYVSAAWSRVYAIDAVSGKEYGPLIRWFPGKRWREPVVGL